MTSTRNYIRSPKNCGREEIGGYGYSSAQNYWKNANLEEANRKFAKAIGDKKYEDDKRAR